jgi:hypothetical protein
LKQLVLKSETKEAKSLFEAHFQNEYSLHKNTIDPSLASLEFIKMLKQN